MNPKPRTYACRARRSALGIAAGLAILAGSGTAQVQPGFAVYSKLNLSAATNPGGLVIFDPLNGISPCTSRPRYTTVTNLPANLVSASTLGGANAVLVRDSDGTVVVGEVGQRKDLAIYHLTLSGAAVKSFRSYSLGRAAGLGQVHQMAFLSETMIAFSHSGVAGPIGTSLPGNGIATLDLVTGAIKSVSVTGIPAGQTPNALTVDRSGRTAYWGLYGATSAVYSVPITGGALKKVGPNLASGPYQLDVDHSGVVHVATFTKGVYALRNGGWVSLDPTVQTNAMAIDRVSGELLFASVPVSTASVMYRLTSTGRKTLTGMPAKDAASGMGVRSSLIPSGIASRRSVPYQWHIAPNPGGQPMVGNKNFSLNIATTARPKANYVGFSTSLLPIPIPIGGAKLYLAGPIVIAPLTSTATGYTVAAPIPLKTAFCGLTIYAQALHAGPSGLASSKALSITVQ